MKLNQEQVTVVYLARIPGQQSQKTFKIGTNIFPTFDGRYICGRCKARYRTPPTCCRRCWRRFQSDEILI